RGKQVDAIDHYTMKLETLDRKIFEARRKEYKATPLAFVTLNSVAAAVRLILVKCVLFMLTVSQQMAVQAVLDPKPTAFIARPAPAPSNIIWRNTYMPRYKRMIRT